MKSLKDLNSKAHVILDSVNDGVVAISLDKKIQYLNPAAERLLGYTLEEAEGLPCATVVHCEACESDCLLDKTVSLRRNISDYPTLIRNRAGRCYTVRSNTALLKNRTGRVIGGVEIIKDLSQVEALTEQIRGKYSFENIVGKNHQMQEIYSLLPLMARAEGPVLIKGEPGTGKELVAQAIHQNGPRAERPFVKVNCAALDEGLLASELFGHIKGAFAGALADKAGKLESAEGGTVFLEEIGRAPRSVQEALFGVIEEGRFNRLGNSQNPVSVNVRIVGSTSQNLEEAVREETFGRDLYDLFGGCIIDLPPLRERRDDIPLLVEHMVKRLNPEMGKRIDSVTQEAMEVLLNYNYPKNIQELESIMAHASVLCDGKTILPSHLPNDLIRLDENFMEFAIRSEDPLKTIERQLILKILSQTEWNYKETAERLKLSRTTLWRKMKALGIERLKSNQLI